MLLCGGVVFLFRRSLPKVSTLIRLGVILLGLTVVFDNYLTGLPIVLYNKNSLWGIYIWRLPLEDLGYVIAVVLLIPVLFEYFTSNTRGATNKRERNTKPTS